MLGNALSVGHVERSPEDISDDVDVARSRVSLWLAVDRGLNQPPLVSEEYVIRKVYLSKNTTGHSKLDQM
jgi:hypothetical protein